MLGVTPACWILHGKSVRKICVEKIFKIFSKNGESGLRGGQNPGIVIRVFGGNLENNIVNNESGCGAAW